MPASGGGGGTGGGISGGGLGGGMALGVGQGAEGFPCLHNNSHSNGDEDSNRQQSSGVRCLVHIGSTALFHYVMQKVHELLRDLRQQSRQSEQYGLLF